MAQGLGQSVREYTNRIVRQQSRHQGQKSESQGHHLSPQKESTSKMKEETKTKMVQ